MKKLLAVLLALVLCIGLVACGTETTEAPTEAVTSTEAETTTEAETSTEAETTTEEETTAAETGVMSYAEYAAAADDDPVVIECYVQAHQSWWDNKITVYAADQDGAYFMYEMACSEEDAAKLTEGVKIRVTGYKTSWSGEVEVASGATFEFIEGADTYVAEAKDLTDKIAAEDLIDYQNQLVTFKGLTVKEIAFPKGDGGDIEVTLTKDDAEYAFYVESYLTDAETDLYKAVAGLKAGDKIDATGFLYWYNGMNPHITAVQAAE